jgi:hypothetical protein
MISFSIPNESGTKAEPFVRDLRGAVGTRDCYFGKSCGDFGWGFIIGDRNMIINSYKYIFGWPKSVAWKTVCFK